VNELALIQLDKLAALRELQRRKNELNLGMVAYFDDPVGFARDCIDWRDKTLAPYQAEILELLRDMRRASFRSMRGAGKSATAAIAVLWFAVTREAAKINWKIVTTAGAWRQLIHFLWPEIHKWASRLRWDKVRDGRRFTRNELQRITLRMEHGEAMAASCSNSGLIEGAHADELLFVFDEAKLIPPSTFDSAEGAMNTGNCYALCLSTPGDPAGRFYEIQSRQKGYEDWGVKAVKLEEVLDFGQVNADWVDQRRRQWGPNSALFHNHVMGEFFAADEDSTIPLRWAELAVDRWEQWVAAGSPIMPGRRVVSCDVARYGTDKTGIMVRQGTMIERMEQHSQQDTMTTTGYVKAYSDYPHSVAVIDVIGIGSGVVDRLREQKQPTIAFNASAKAVWADGRKMRDKTGEFTFVNMRAASWWGLRESWDPSTFPGCSCKDGDPADRNCFRCTGALGVPGPAMDGHVQLMGDLTAPKWSITSAAAYQIESKKQIRERLGRSTDLGDTAVMAAWYSGAVGDGDPDGSAPDNVIDYAGEGEFDPSDRPPLRGWDAREDDQMVQDDFDRMYF
jgi:hypothetical protein